MQFYWVRLKVVVEIERVFCEPNGENVRVIDKTWKSVRLCVRELERARAPRTHPFMCVCVLFGLIGDFLRELQSIEWFTNGETCPFSFWH